MLQVQKVTNKWSEGLPGGITWYFIGQPKSGKTTQASKWSPKGSDGVLVIDTDLGADFVDGANVLTISSLNPPTRDKKKDGVVITKSGKPVIEVIPPEDRGYYYRNGSNKGKPMPVYSLAEVVSDLLKNWNEYPYDTIVIDTIDQVNTWIENTVKVEMGIAEMGQGEWGSDWAKARKKNVDVLQKLQRFLKQVGGNLVLISHAKNTVVTDAKAQLAPSLPSGLGRAVCAKADVIGYTTIDKETNDYMISFEGYDERMVGSRLRPLAQKLLPFDYDSIIKEINSFKEEKK